MVKSLQKSKQKSREYTDDEVLLACQVRDIISIAFQVQKLLEEGQKAGELPQVLRQLLDGQCASTYE